MIKLTEEAIAQVAEEMYSGDGTCIECGGKYFHTPLCQKGFGLNRKELVQRLQKRATEIQSRENLILDKCSFCGKDAEGTFWVAYHGYAAILKANPSCEDCSVSQSGDDGRPSGFLPNTVTKSTYTVHRVLKDFLVGL